MMSLRCTKPHWFHNLCSTFNLVAARYNSVLDDLVPSDKLPKRLVSSGSSTLCNHPANHPATSCQPANHRPAAVNHLLVSQ